MQGRENTRASDVFRYPVCASDYDSGMASERTGHVAASDPTLHAAWDVAQEALERRSESRALSHSADRDAAEAFLLEAAQTQGSERHELLRRGAEQLLLNGQV